jgi:hypothetical protein
MTRHGRTVGHEFAVEFELYDIRDCTLEWWEKTNVPYTAAMRAAEWMNMTVVHPSSDVFTPWANQVRLTPVGQTIFRVIDPPGIMVNETKARELYFDIRVHGGDDRRHVTAVQRIILDQSGRGKDLIEFRVLANDVECVGDRPTW